MTTPREEKEIARNEILFRHVNERIADLSNNEEPEPDLVVLCECGRAECLHHIQVPAPAYAEVREHGGRFIILPDHLEPDVEVIVQREAGFFVVEKAGMAGELAEEDYESSS